MAGGRWFLGLMVSVVLVAVGCEISSDNAYDETPPPEQTAEGEAVNTEEAETSPEDEQTIYAQQLGIDNSEYYGETFGGSGCEAMPLEDGAGGFVSNPENVRGTLKFVFPTSWGGSINRVTVFTAEGAFFDEFYRHEPNEEDGRRRYYGTKPIRLYPANLYLRVLMNDGTCRSVQIPNPKQRYT